MGTTIMWYILGFYRDTGKENGSYYNVVYIVVILG